jgi:glyoxylase-like metal-dependent hydrolase (beta-lactamase superfamily II)
MRESAGLSRRRFLRTAAGGALALTARDAVAARLGWAGQNAVYKSGELEVVAVSDGHFLLPTGFLLRPDSPPAERQSVLDRSRTAGDQLQLPNNVAVIRSASGVILVDAGTGPRHQPTAGKLAGNLEAAGIPLTSITTVVLTHGHPDHLWGVLDAADNPVYRNAVYVMSARERDLWSDPDVRRALPSVFASDRIVDGANRCLARIRERIKTVRDGDEIASGVRVIETPGHTQGHVSVELTRGDGLLIAADALTHPVISFEYPSWRVPVDHEADRGIATRLRLLDRLAADKLRLLGAHLPPPGMGFVERKGAVYRFVPA